jgi:hypothetical protein
MTHAEDIFSVYKDEPVEIFVDGIIGRQMYNDYEVEEKAIIEGIVRGAVGEMLVLECELSTPAQNYKCEILVNGWTIKAIIKKSQNVPLLAVINLAQKFRRKR